MHDIVERSKGGNLTVGPGSQWQIDKVPESVRREFCIESAGLGVIPQRAATGGGSANFVCPIGDSR
jgi:hypothetical protein